MLRLETLEIVWGNGLTKGSKNLVLTRNGGHPAPRSVVSEVTKIATAPGMGERHTMLRWDGQGKQEQGGGAGKKLTNRRSQQMAILLVAINADVAVSQMN